MDSVGRRWGSRFVAYSWLMIERLTTAWVWRHSWPTWRKCSWNKAKLSLSLTKNTRQIIVGYSGGHSTSHGFKMTKNQIWTEEKYGVKKVKLAREREGPLKLSPVSLKLGQTCTLQETEISRNEYSSWREINQVWLLYICSSEIKFCWHEYPGMYTCETAEFGGFAVAEGFRELNEIFAGYGVWEKGWRVIREAHIWVLLVHSSIWVEICSLCRPLYSQSPLEAK